MNIANSHPSIDKRRLLLISASLVHKFPLKYFEMNCCEHEQILERDTQGNELWTLKGGQLSLQQGKMDFHRTKAYVCLCL